MIFNIRNELLLGDGYEVWSMVAGVGKWYRKGYFGGNCRGRDTSGEEGS